VLYPMTDPLDPRTGTLGRPLEAALNAFTISFEGGIIPSTN
jgi:hypothetical protein